MNPRHSTPLLTPEDLSVQLGVPVTTLYVWRSRNQGPPGMRIGKHVRYRQSDVDVWLDAQAEKTGA